jgi:RNase H-fold protein (predicted Holliday junction resolvase)
MFLLQVVIFLFLTLIKVNSFDAFRARLAIDYGPRLVGVAGSLGPIVQPLCTIPNHANLTLLSGEIINLARAQGAIEIIVGVPLDKDGVMKYSVRNLNGVLCLNFSSVLATVCARSYPKGSVLIVDERYTTREAREKSKKDYTRASLDAVSAACLLERYIEDEGDFNVLPALPCPFPIPKDLENFDYGIVQTYIRLTKYSNADLTSANQQTMMKKFGVRDGSRRRRNGDEEEAEGFKVHSFNRLEHRRLLSLEQMQGPPEELVSSSSSDGSSDSPGSSTVASEELSEESEESEEEMQYRIRAMRRKRGTLKK